ncbi:MAG: hypothetical protein MPEBLZ_00563 [Candidatus Methanoperedens nitroreducens]|uniref:RiboL-PSP-HEPN domain-containing protein n=1 Tax=Candidatus Methanoperedens nitratireducens TaxID=1392998 RepID=A0A0N8KRG0_9EURY|nr:HEPN domain-containing protein [Candidatus Methanoperedens sp. BLZ2]KAB2940874.1 MAG: hypothetical protein F9K14_18955 [Candidatus Methanoperedens sp.]KPQ44834.1 MAG: hypothetical protein MPEBLZ_00563 [Candidatus Methanoperedens sp. BLZ1]MBZ0177228.1 DUF3006 domain-containing protein [Candidatus Methanoperedens nitroreducens]MCX9077139.1 hypothetical protein [Candidatus Methanoperedens sp.]
MLRTDRIHYETFQYNIGKAKALITIQDTLDKLVEGKFNFSQIFEKLGKDILQETEGKIQINEELTKRMEERIKDKQKEIKESIKSLENIFESLQTVYERPLYQEAVVIIVGSFETYLKDTVVTLVAKNKSVEDKFYKELKDSLNYSKLRESGYDWENLLGHLVAEKFNFYDTQQINELYSRILKIDNIFKNKSVKKRIQNFIKLRHLIVHKSGIVDKKFKNETQTKVPLDVPYPVEKKYVLDMIRSISKVVEDIEKNIREKEFSKKEKGVGVEQTK